MKKLYPFDHHGFQWCMLTIYIICLLGSALDQNWSKLITYLALLCWVIAYMIKERSV